MTTTTASATIDGDDYRPMLDAINDQFYSLGSAPLFTTDASDLWERYLDALPPDQRQHHTCHACRHFVERFGNLATIDEQGRLSSAIFGATGGMYRLAFDVCERTVEQSRVTGVFVSSLETWGLPTNKDRKRATSWRHMSIVPPSNRVYRGVTKEAHEVAAEKVEDYGMLCRALADFDRDTITQALAIVGAEALYRGEKVAGHLKWISELHAKREALRGRMRENITWLAVATAPAGFCHVRSSMVSTLLEDVAEKLPFETIKAKFAEKMNPLQYRRPTAAPSAGNIAQAEKIIAAMQATGSLARRFAKLEEVKTLWTPTPPPVKPAPAGVFAHLLPSQVSGVGSPITAPSMTWEKFRRTILPDAIGIECMVPRAGNFIAFVTAADPSAPPILQWDAEDARNPVSWYLYNHGSKATQWTLVGGTHVEVPAISELPFMWGARRGADHGEGVVFLLKGCRDTHDSGSGLFPEILKSEFHGISKTIEAYSGRAQLAGREEASACGLMLRKGARDEGIRLRVTMRDASVVDHSLDRWD